MVLKVGTFDNPALFNPQMAIHTLDKQAFHHVPDGMPSLSGCRSGKRQCYRLVPA